MEGEGRITPCGLRAAVCPDHRGETCRLWCVRDEAPACVMCFLEGRHKGHDYEKMEAVEARQLEAELARVEAAIDAIDAATKLAEVIDADEQKSAREAREAKKRYLGRLLDVVMLREKALSDEIDEWEQARDDQAGRRRATLGWARRRLEDERKAIRQAAGAGGPRKRESAAATAAEVCQKANAVAAEVEAESLCPGRISFASAANIAEGGTASADLIAAILHAGHLHLHVRADEPEGDKEESDGGRGEPDSRPDRPSTEESDDQLAADPQDVPMDQDLPDARPLSRKRRRSTHTGDDTTPQSGAEGEKEVADTDEGTRLRKSNRTRIPTARAQESSVEQKKCASAYDEASGQAWFASVWRAAVPKDATAQHGAALRLVGGDKLTQQVTPLPSWASPLPEALETAITEATGASTVTWDSQGPLGPVITLKFAAVQPFMARGPSVKLYLGYKQARAGDLATTVLE